MGLLNIFGRKDTASNAAATPYSISTELVPYKLYAKKNSSALLEVRLTNMTKDVLLTSLTVEVPAKIGLDEMIVSRQKDLKIGEMQPSEQKDVKLSIFSSIASDPGEYTLQVTATAHYRDYGHVLNMVKKRVTVSVV